MITAHLSEEMQEAQAKAERVLASMEGEEILSLRSQALQEFLAEGWPGKKAEEWKYTSLLPFSTQNFEFSPPAFRGDINASALSRVSACNRIVLLNGRYSAEHSQLLDHPEQLEVLPILSAWKKYKEEISLHYDSLMADYNDPISRLNTAFCTPGFFLRIKAGAALKYPIVVEQHFMREGAVMLYQPRNLIFVEKAAKATIIFDEVFDFPIFLNAANELFLEDEAFASINFIQDGGEQTHHINTLQIAQGKESSSNVQCISLGGKLLRNTVHVRLNGSLGHTSLNGLYMPSNNDVIDNHVAVIHGVPNCESYQLYKGVMSNNSSGVFNGKINVLEGAFKTNAYQSNKNLLLSDEATINTKPQLEIFADDVKCSHGATVGQLDEKALFYLKARGIPADMALRMLTNAFVNDVIEKLPEIYLSFVLHLMEEKLEQSHAE